MTGDVSTDPLDWFDRDPGDETPHPPPALCPACAGWGYVEYRTACALCKGTGVVPAKGSDGG